MALVFDARNPESGCTTRFYFSLSDHQSDSPTTDSEEKSREYLSLGLTVGDWNRMTSVSAATLYSDLIDDSRKIFSELGHKDYSCRQVEVLVGNLAALIANRLARSMNQVERIPLRYLPDFSTLSTLDALELKLPNRTIESYRLLLDDQFGEFVDYISLCMHFGNTRKRLIFFDSEESAGTEDQGRSGLMGNNSPNGKVLPAMYLALQRLLASTSARSPISIVITYLGRAQEVALSLLMKQVPALLELRPTTTEDAELKASREPQPIHLSSYREAAMCLMGALMPVSVLEHFDSTLRRAYSVGFSRNPTLVFTSNSYDTDDEFKVHLASALPTASYVVGQHGNNFGISTSTNICPELNASDVFLSWGWTNDDAKVVPFGQLKPKIRGRLRSKLKGITVFLRDEYIGFLQGDMYGPNQKYVKSVTQFCGHLNDLGVATHLRFHHSASEKFKGEVFREIREMEFVTIAETRPSIVKLLSSGMGIVFGYDSTGMLEMGSARIPFFCFAPDGIDMVREEYRQNYEALKGAGLYSEDPHVAANLIAAWIGAPKAVRKAHLEAIDKFTDGIVSYPRNKIRRLAKILKAASASPHL